MALPAWQASIVDDHGEIIPSPVITVIVEATGQPAELFSDRAGIIPLGANGVFTASVGGFAQFFVTPSECRITASDAGTGFSHTLRFVSVMFPQTSTVDSTPGAAMQVGSFGGGGQGVTVPDDADDPIQSGFFRTVAAAANTPDALNAKMIQMTYDTENITQIWESNAVRAPGRLETRRKDSGVWSPWLPIYTGANYQPETSLDGVGVVKYMRNITGANIGNQSVTAGSNLESYVVVGSNWFPAGLNPSGTWRNVGGSSITPDNGTLFVRVA